MPRRTPPRLTCFHSPSGELVIAQAPNIPLWLAVGCYMLRWTPLPLANILSDWGVTLTMLYWAAWEVTTGVNYWRRGLGLCAGGYFGWQLIKLLT